MPLSPRASCMSKDPGLKDNAVLLLVAVRLSVCGAFLSILCALYLRTHHNSHAAQASILQLETGSEKTAGSRSQVAKLLAAPSPLAGAGGSSANPCAWICLV